MGHRADFRQQPSTNQKPGTARKAACIRDHFLGSYRVGGGVSQGDYWAELQSSGRGFERHPKAIPVSHFCYNRSDIDRAETGLHGGRKRAPLRLLGFPTVISKRPSDRRPPGRTPARRITKLWRDGGAKLLYFAEEGGAKTTISCVRFFLALGSGLWIRS